MQVMSLAGETTFQGDPITEQVGIIMPNTLGTISSWKGNSRFLPLISAASGDGHYQDTVPSKPAKENMEVQGRNSHADAAISPLQTAVLTAGACHGGSKEWKHKQPPCSITR